MEALYGYFIHFNHFTELWAAMPREGVRDYLNGVENKDILYHTNMESLIKEIKAKEDER